MDFFRLIILLIYLNLIKPIPTPPQYSILKTQYFQKAYLLLLQESGRQKRKGGAMQCFFYGTNRERKEGDEFNAYVSFTIPEIGIVFRAQFKGKPNECEYASLLALLEFIELNPQFFKSRRIEIYGDSFLVVHQVNMKMVCSKELEPYRNMALVYKKKIPYTLSWIPKNENPAQEQMQAV
jgi:ribonuclease HI